LAGKIVIKLAVDNIRKTFKQSSPGKLCQSKRLLEQTERFKKGPPERADKSR